MALNEESLKACLEKAGGSATVILNSDGESVSERIINMDLEQAAIDAGGSSRMANAVAAGVVFALLDCDTAPLKKLLSGIE